MQSFVLLLECPSRDHFQEILFSTRQFLQSRTPKRRERVHIYLLDPPGPLLDLLEQIRAAGLQDRFQVVHRSDQQAFHRIRNRADVWLTTGRISHAWMMNEICQRGKILIQYHFRPQNRVEQANWHFQIHEGHPHDRQAHLFELLTKLYEDPEALRWLRRSSHQGYNSYCNQITRDHLIQTMDQVIPAAKRLSA